MDLQNWYAGGAVIPDSLPPKQKSDELLELGDHVKVAINDWTSRRNLQCRYGHIAAMRSDGTAEVQFSDFTDWVPVEFLSRVR